MTKKKTVKKKVGKKKAINKGKNGRPTKYKKELNNLVYNLTLLRLTDTEIAKTICISEATLNTWKLKHPKFLESIKAGKEIADAEVVRSLRDRALGYSHPEEKIFCTDGQVTRVETTKHYPPETQAASLWLRNRQPEKWRDKQDIEVKQSLTDKSLEEIQAMIAAANKEIETLTSEDNQHKE